jgi:alcohol dehydrogenase, propanol-preferring
MYSKPTWVVTRSENHIRQARELGAAWAGCDFRDVPGKADGAVLFAPSGKLVPPTLEALDRGGVCSIAGIHLSDVPNLDYKRHLYQERELLSVTANTREDLRTLLAEAVEAHVQPHTTVYALSDTEFGLGNASSPFTWRLSPRFPVRSCRSRFIDQMAAGRAIRWALRWRMTDRYHAKARG